MTYFDGSHDDRFYILTEDDHALYHALEVIKDSPGVQWFSIDHEDGIEFFENLENQLYPSASTAPRCVGNYYDKDAKRGTCTHPSAKIDTECKEYPYCEYRVDPRGSAPSANEEVKQ